MNATIPSVLVPCDRRRILIADDEAPVRKIFRMILANGFPQFTFDVAANGLDAVETFCTGHHGLLLMDLMMPVMDGQTAFYKIRDFCEEKGWEMPTVVFCTGYASSLNMEALSSPKQHHCLLQKPVTREMLLDVVKARLSA